MNAILLTPLFGILFMLLGVFRKNRAKELETFSIFSVAFILLSVIGEAFDADRFRLAVLPYEQIEGWIALDGGALRMQIILCVCLLFYFMANAAYIAEHAFPTEMVALLLFSATGIFLIVSFKSLLILFLGIEIFALPQYILAGSRKHIPSSIEASLKYFLMGAFFSSILLFGIAFMYGATGSFEASPILSLPDYLSPLLFAGITLVIIALLFKVGIAPFHFWVPDVYQGSPTYALGFMSGISKIGTCLLLFRFFDIYQINHLPYGKFLTLLISVCIILSLTIANLLAIYQKKYKRMIAYSGIAQGAFMLFALYDTSEYSFRGLSIFAIGYAFALIGIFSVMNELFRVDKDEESFDGLAKRSPLSALLVTISLFSLAGIPATAGFLGKFYMLVIAIDYGGLGIVIVAVFFSALSLYYYMRMIRQMYFEPPKENSPRFSLSILRQITYSALIFLLIAMGLGLGF